MEKVQISNKCSIIENITFTTKRPNLAEEKSFFVKIMHWLISVLTMTKLNESKDELFEHPPYGPGLASIDYYPFKNLKQLVRGKSFHRMKKLFQSF